MNVKLSPCLLWYGLKIPLWNVYMIILLVETFTFKLCCMFKQKWTTVLSCSLALKGVFTFHSRDSFFVERTTYSVWLLREETGLTEQRRTLSTGIGDHGCQQRRSVQRRLACSYAVIKTTNTCCYSTTPETQVNARPYVNVIINRKRSDFLLPDRKSVV